MRCHYFCQLFYFPFFLFFSV
uniref:Uncharacterized protein n=1 Tax=Anguilla anguilla TaxID=7936 RepID=A0A0E9SJI4_ANGAN